MTDKNGQDGTKKVMLGSFSDGKKVLEKKLKDGTITTKYQTTHLTGTGWHTDEDATEEMGGGGSAKQLKNCTIF